MFFVQPGPLDVFPWLTVPWHVVSIILVLSVAQQQCVWHLCCSQQLQFSVIFTLKGPASNTFRCPCWFFILFIEIVQCVSYSWRDARYIIKIKIHSSCEIEDFCRNPSLQAVCDTPIARITGCVSSWRIWVGDSPCNYGVLIAIGVNRVMLVSLCAETVKPVCVGDKIWKLWKEMHQFIKCTL